MNISFSTTSPVSLFLSCAFTRRGAAYVVSRSLHSSIEYLGSSSLSSDVPALTAVRIGEEIRQIDNIAECTFVPKDTALSGVMQDIDGGGTLFDSFTGDNNPLPDSYEISLADLSIYDETVSRDYRH